MLHAISDPGNFLAGRASPLFRSAVETYTGRDEYGRKVPTHNIAVNVLNSVAPIPLQSAEKAITGQSPELSNADQLEKAGGLTVTPYQTEAVRLAASLASDRSSSGPVDPAQLRRHQALMKFEDDLRTGAMTEQQLSDAVDAGVLAPDAAKRILRNLQQTAGMPDDLAMLVTRARNLPMDDLLQAWDAASAEERKALAPVMKQKRSEYIGRAFSSMTPLERLNDPTFQRTLSWQLSAP